MTSNFYIVHHEFRAGTSSKWWKTAYAAMSPGGGWDEAVAANKEKGFYNHSANALTSNGPLCCIWSKSINEYLQTNRHIINERTNSIPKSFFLKKLK